MTTLNTAINTTASKTVQTVATKNPVLRQNQMRRINHLLGKVGKALALSTMVQTK